MCNRGNSAISVRMAVAVNDTPTNGEYIEYDVEVLARGCVGEILAFMDAGKKLVVYPIVQS